MEVATLLAVDILFGEVDLELEEPVTKRERFIFSVLGGEIGWCRCFPAKSASV